MKKEDIIAKMAQENKKIAMEKARANNPNNVGEQLTQKSAETVKPIETRTQAAKEAGVSHDTYTKAGANKGEVPVAVLPQSLTIFSSRYHH